jgi:hypothetical protein
MPDAPAARRRKKAASASKRSSPKRSSPSHPYRSPSAVERAVLGTAVGSAAPEAPEPEPEPEQDVELDRTQPAIFEELTARIPKSSPRRKGNKENGECCPLLAFTARGKILPLHRRRMVTFFPSR